MLKHRRAFLSVIHASGRQRRLVHDGSVLVRKLQGVAGAGQLLGWRDG